ncbi:MAG: DUF3592 domain-containing protein [Oscillospiraceae bacterium]|nr:DUF3592 domain-containing protein [Oscillospiraceae bacterium]
MEKFKRSNPLLVMSLMLLFMGTVFLIVGTAVAVVIQKTRSDFMETAVKTEATIVDIRVTGSGDDRVHRVDIRFYDRDGNEIITRLSYYSSSMRVGQQIVIWYNPDNPYSVMDDGGEVATVLVLFIFGTVGLITLICGGIMLSRQLKKGALRERLAREGCYVMADVTEHGLSNTRVNRRRLFRIKCVYSDGFTTHEFEDGYLFDNPLPYITPDNKIRVCVDRNDYGKYFIDIGGERQEHTV